MKIRGGIHTTGNGNVVNISGRMSDIKTEVNKGMTGVEEIDNLINTLVGQVELVAQSDEAGAEEIVENLERLVSEANKKKPSRKWYELSIDGLREASTAVGDIGEPILKTLALLSPLLL